jgi:hypothetical protein
MTQTLRLARLAIACSLSTLALATVAQTNESRADANALAQLQRDFEASAQQGLVQAQQATARAVASLLGAAAETLNPDELEAAIAERVPGFAGFVHREDGTVQMRMTAASGMASTGARSLRESTGPAADMARSMGVEVSVAPALFDSRQLLDMKQKSFALASVNGVIGTWIDREANRVEVTYNEKLDAEGISKVTAQLAAAGVPAHAIILKPGELMQPRQQVGTSIRSQRPPLAAGSQFAFNAPGGSFVCSVGVPAVRNGVVGFVTASHCSARTYQNNGTQTFAPSISGTFLGSESVDPAGTNCNPQAALGCRASDSLFVAASQGNGTVAFGRVALTNSSLTVTGSIPVRGTINQVSVGQLVYKTGRTTGLRSGRIARTCVDALVGDGQGGPNYVAQCSTEINSSSFSAGGDSGSSIWVYDGVGALISGILSYGSTNRTGFSPWGGVVRDLGTLTVR